MDKQTKSVPLTEKQRSALQAICRQRKVDALVCKRARAFLLLDAGYDAKTICEILDIGPTVLPEWRFAFAGAGLSFFGLKDYSQRQGHLSVEQERATQAHFTEHSARNADKVCAYTLAEHDQSYSASGAAKLMRRLGFVYKKPQSLPAQADEIKQAAFIAHYEALMTGLRADEMVVFSDAVHPEHQSRPAHGWFPKTQKIALKATSGRKRLNIQAALDLETFQFTLLDNARYHHAKILQPWLERSERQVKLHFLPPYAPHLNPIERLWGVMHKCVTHNRHYATFDQFTEAILGFFRKTLPLKWRAFTDTVTDNFRIISLDEYKVI